MSEAITADEANKIYLEGIVKQLDDVFYLIGESAKTSTSVTLDGSDWDYQTTRWHELSDALVQFGYDVTYDTFLRKTKVSWKKRYGLVYETSS